MIHVSSQEINKHALPITMTNKGGPTFNMVFVDISLYIC
jgi:hypothetical protein